MPVELLSCPFCGAASDLVCGRIEADGGMLYYAKCPVCLAENAGSRQRAEAIAAWNRRISPASETIARVKERLKAITAKPRMAPNPIGPLWASGFYAGQEWAASIAAQALADLAGTEGGET